MEHLKFIANKLQSDGDEEKAKELLKHIQTFQERANGKQSIEKCNVYVWALACYACVSVHVRAN